MPFAPTLNLESDIESQEKEEEVFTPPTDYEGRYYDPEDPPKITITSNNEIHYTGGSPIDKEKAYSRAYWEYYKDLPEEQLTHTKIQMEQQIREGAFSIDVLEPSEEGEYDPLDQARIYAYKVMAEDMGYDDFGYEYDEDSKKIIVETEHKNEVTSLV